MTMPATAEALVDQIARILDPDAHHLGRPDYYGPEPILAGASARVRVARKSARAIIAGPLAPLLAAHQQVTAERDALNTKLAEVTRPWVDEEGRAWLVPTAWAYAKACGALHKHRGRASAAKAALAAIKAERADEREAHALSARERNLFASKLVTAEAALATANDELARLRAEGEASKEAGRPPFSMDPRAQAAVLADLPPSVAQEAGEFYESAGAPSQKALKKREAMAVAWASVLRPYLIGLRDHHDRQARPASPRSTGQGG